jgi:ribosome-associated toxin RatA of RatAB toxin-antitoxin module
MPIIEASVIIKGSKNEVFEVIKNMEDFPRFMRDVKSLNIIKRISEDRIITAWKTEIDGAPVYWKEEDFFDQANYQVKFNMLEGNYKEYQGYWLIQPSHNSIKLSIKLEVDWGIPVLEKYVGKALEAKARRGLLGMLHAIKNKVEKKNV